MPQSARSFRRQWLLWFLLLAIPLLVVLAGALWAARGFQLADELAHDAAYQRLWLTAAQEDISRVVLKMGSDIAYLQREPDAAQTLAGDAGAQGRMQRRLLDFVDVQQVYLRARLFDVQGVERMRIERRSGHAVVVPPGQLQDKRDRPYVQQASLLQPGQIFLSGIDLAVENNQLVRPYEPVIRLTAPLFDAEGRRLGSIVLSYRAQRLLDWLAMSSSQHGTVEHWLLDDVGGWLLGGSEQDRWASILHSPDGKTLAQRNPALWQAMQYGSGSWHGAGDEYVFLRLQPYGMPKAAGFASLAGMVASDGDRSWYLVARFTPQAMISQATRVDRNLLPLGGAGLATVLVFSALVATLISLRARRFHMALDAERELIRLLETAPVGAYVIDAKGRTIYANPFLCRVTGLSAAAALAPGWLGIVHPDDREEIAAAYTAGIQQGSYDLQCRILLEDGTTRWIRVFAHADTAASGERPDHHVGTLLDVTEQRETEQALRASLDEAITLHTQLDSIMASTADPIVTVDKSLCFERYNQAYLNLSLAMYGKPPAAGEKLTEFFAEFPRLREEVLARWRRVLHGEQLSLRSEVLHDRVFDLAYTPRYDNNNHLAGGVLTMHEMTEVLRTQAALRERETRTLSALNSSPDVISLLEVVLGDDGVPVDFVVMDANLAAATWLSVPLEKQIGARLSELLPPDECARLMQDYWPVYANGGTVEKELQTDDGRWWVRQVRRWREGVVIRISEITAHKNDQLALVKSFAWQNAVIDAAPFPIIATNAAGVITLMNTAAERLLDYPMLEALAEPPKFESLLDTHELELGAQRRSTERRSMVIPSFDVFRMMAAHGPLREEWTLVGRNGGRNPVALTVTEVLGSSTEKTGYLFIARDLAQLKLIERRLSESDRRNNLLVANIREGVVVSDMNAAVLQVNAALCAMYGYSETEMVGMRLTRLLSAEDAALMRKVRERLMAGETNAFDDGSLRELTAVHADGHTFPIETTVTDFELDGQRYFTSIVRDISERKRYEAKLHDTIKELEISQRIARQANEQLLEANMELQRLAQLDGLTGVANRRFFDQQLQHEWARAQRESQPLAVLMIDVDHFKAFNDNYGHHAGDDALKSVAHCLANVLNRPADLLARYGGEEFVLVLPNTSGEGALHVGEKLRASVEQLAIPHAFSSAGPYLTISCGAAARVPEEHISPDALLQLADAALYHAKRAGRNRVMVDEGGETAETVTLT
ncbi:sensor domain-containing diguanylate cyclase [Andreprevotia chitinilytica]|uniref:sensor domain-containing diguanylate cyclase n=1 Tax=Andreprevotia chitinilytica TaxID=396808 RepID=UPI00069161AB|nr:diguanylate cyclase [Andreprevotia chitinilytica]